METKHIFAILFLFAALSYLMSAFLMLETPNLSPATAGIFFIIALIMIITVFGIYKDDMKAYWLGFIVSGFGILDGFLSMIRFSVFTIMSKQTFSAQMILFAIHTTCFILLYKMKKDLKTK